VTHIQHWLIRKISFSFLVFLFFYFFFLRFATSQGVQHRINQYFTSDCNNFVHITEIRLCTWILCSIECPHKIYVPPISSLDSTNQTALALAIGIPSHVVAVGKLKKLKNHISHTINLVRIYITGFNACRGEYGVNSVVSVRSLEWNRIIQNINVIDVHMHSFHIDWHD
jgi:hypothetical protein